MTYEQWMESEESEAYRGMHIAWTPDGVLASDYFPVKMLEALEKHPRKQEAILGFVYGNPNGWRPVISAPKDGTRVLVLWNFEKGPVMDVIEQDAMGWFDSTSGEYAQWPPDFWMPLPKLPE